jgi:hypothetical protein
VWEEHWGVWLQPKVLVCETLQQMLVVGFAVRSDWSHAPFISIVAGPLHVLLLLLVYLILLLHCVNRMIKVGLDAELGVPRCLLLVLETVACVVQLARRRHSNRRQPRLMLATVLIRLTI